MKCVVAGLLATLSAHAAPNVVVLFPDEWRAQAFGYAGDPNVITPNLDRMQKESVHCVNAVSGVPVCCPMRATLLTGQRVLTHGVFMNDVSLSPQARTMGEMFKDAGYDTAYIGKWHVDGHGRSNFIPRERRHGFDYWKVLECTHDYNNSFYYADGPEKLKWEGYDAIAQTRDAQKYLREHAGSKKPFILVLSWGPPHDPYQTAPEKYRAMYQADKLKLRPNVPEALQQKARNNLLGYYSHCTALDDCVGDIWTTLKETGLEENTLVVFLSDHGDMLQSHGQDFKQKPHDESIRVPLLWHWPKEFGRKLRPLDAPINTEDLLPTLLGLCGVSVPKSVEGLDFSGYLRGGKSPSDGAALISCPAPFGQWPRAKGGKEYRGVRTTRYTYARDLQGPWLLFDNEKDPYQLDNLAGKPQAASVQAELERVLQSKLRDAHDEFLPGEKYIQKWGYTVDKTGTVPYEK